MAEGEPAARAVLDQIYRTYQRDALPVFLMLHSMNIRGGLITLAQSICNNDIDRMVKAVKSSNGYFIQALNQLAAQSEIEERAHHAENIYEVKCR